MKLGDVVPDFTAESTHGTLRFHEWIGDSWAILCSHPGDYTPVCTTELGRMAQMEADFAKRGVKLAALSCNDVDSHVGWTKDIEAYGSTKVNYPIIADPKRELAVLYGMVDPDAKDAAGLPLTCRAVFFIGPDKKLKSQILYPASTGRNFTEVLRALDSLQLGSSHPVATPVDWQRGDKVMIVPSLSPEDAKTRFPDHEVKQVPSGKEYIRMTEDPATASARTLAAAEVQPL
eukprot:jgi/Chlat1/8267/Chrsp78S07700